MCAEPWTLDVLAEAAAAASASRAAAEVGLGAPGWVRFLFFSLLCVSSPFSKVCNEANALLLEFNQKKAQEDLRLLFSSRCSLERARTWLINSTSSRSSSMRQPFSCAVFELPPSSQCQTQLQYNDEMKELQAGALNGMRHFNFFAPAAMKRPAQAQQHAATAQALPCLLLPAGGHFEA